MNLGQLFLIGIEGVTLSEEEIAFVQDFQPAGIFLTDQNYESLGQMAELINSVQSLRTDFPFIIAVNFEGQAKFNMAKNFISTLHFDEILKIDSPKIFFEVSQLLSKQLMAIGVNCNFAPSCNMFTEDWMKYVSAVIRGQETQGIMSCAKVTGPINFENKKVSASLLRASKARVPLMMLESQKKLATDVADNETLVKTYIETFRKHIRFEGAIVSEDLVRRIRTPRDSITVDAFNALKNDFDLLFISSFEKAKVVFDELMVEYRNQKFKNIDLQSKYQRIKALKTRYLANYKAVDLTGVSLHFAKTESDKLEQEVQLRIGRFCRS